MPCAFFLGPLLLVVPSPPRWSGKPRKPHILSTWALLAHIVHSGWIQSISHGRKQRCFWCYLMFCAHPSPRPLSFLFLCLARELKLTVFQWPLKKLYCTKCCPYILGPIVGLILGLKTVVTSNQFLLPTSETRQGSQTQNVCGAPV